MFNTLTKPLFNIFYKWRPPEAVSYWRTKDAARARVLRDPNDGSIKMEIEGEKYLYPGFPRAHILFGSLSKLKHKAKNLIFNEVWAMLEAGKQEEVPAYLKTALPELLQDIQACENDMVPPSRMNPAVREIWRAFEEVEFSEKDSEKRKQINLIKKGVTFALNEDDAYRMRVQWLAPHLRKASFVGLERVLKLLEHAEIVMDMKLRAKLISRVGLTLLKDPEIGDLVNKVVKEIKWKKLYLTKADKYYFRGKYFKCDHGHFDY